MIARLSPAAGWMVLGALVLPSVAVSQDGAAMLKEPGDRQMMAAAIGEVPVFDASGVQVGDAEGVVMGYDGAVAALLVGVGGMLGVLEKPVAVRFDHLTLTEDGEGNRRIDLDLTRAQLDVAPRFEKP